MKYDLAVRLPDKKQAFILQMEGETKLWDATLVKSGNVKRIHIGWKMFAQHYGLEVGDICLFKLADGDTRSLKMTVYVIRKSEIEL
jgi:hypothetical protein